ncbi:MAG: methylenetetrahydrofolate--tRNA-(uracil(54)-C(5))-methyltransferase (FADH(2)-oxidizing) TrmFO, partial [Armatimonadota bacterium]
KHSVPGGEALAVDRHAFAEEVTQHIESHPNIRVVRQEFNPEALYPTTPTVIATGPLTSEALSNWLRQVTGQDHLFFYDAVSPTVTAESIDRSVVWEQSRYDKGDAAYLNCPMTREEYERFVDALLAAEQAPLHDFENGKYFEGCLPIEEIARRGRESLRFGNFKPVGLTDPRTGKRPYAAVQLRPENRERSLYSLVACQNRLRWGAQKEVLRLIPGLENAEFVRLGVIHRNTYVNSPRVLNCRLVVRTERVRGVVL